MVPPRGDVANEQNVSYVNAKSEKALSISCLCCVPVPTCITFPNQGNPSIALWRKKKSNLKNLKIKYTYIHPIHFPHRSINGINFL